MPVLMLRKRPAAGDRKPAIILSLAVMLVAGMAPGAMAGDEPSEQATVFEPRPMTTDDYAVGPVEVKYVKAPDGANMYVEYYKPVRGLKGIDPTPPYPVVLVMTPYANVNNADSVYQKMRDKFVPKGYAFAIGHVYGTGNSEGCQELYGPKEIAAASAVVEWLGTAPWSNGRVGMIGTSYDAGEALHVAALGSEAAKQHLAAVVSDAGVVSYGDVFGHDGVPQVGGASGYAASSAAVSQGPAAGTCRVDSQRAANDYELSGDISTWIGDRSARRGVSSVVAPTLMFQGFHDSEVNSMSPVGFFDRIPSTTPHKLVLGQWAHAQSGPSFYRADGFSMKHAWFDRFLIGLPTGVEDWPEVQIQDSAGRWRSEPTWPSTRGPEGQLALDGDLTLGTTKPVGSSAYVEVDREDTDDPTELTFTSPRFTSPFHIVGQPVLDLWVELDRDDAHIAAVFRAFDESGNLITAGPLANGPTGDDKERQPVLAFRSVRHIDPIRDGEFRQAAGDPAPVGEPLHVPVRFQFVPDVVVPAGGKISIRIAGTSLPDYQSTPSGSDTRVTILHDCEHPSALRFLMPRAEPEFLEVSMKKDTDPNLPGDQPQPQLVPVDADTGGRLADGGLATEKVCGKQPLDPQKVVEHP